MDIVRIAAVQPHTCATPGMHQVNIDYACTAIREAAANDAHIVCFPETFPGPTRSKYRFDPTEVLAEAARKNNIHVIFGTSEEVKNGLGQYFLTEVLLDSNGKKVGTYHRTCPPGPWIYQGGDFWDLNYKTDDELPVFDTTLGKIGLLVCSEVYLPELARVLAVKGAEIIFLPAGTNKYSLLNTWQILIRARAIENLAYTVTCNNLLWEEASGGLAMIAGPEGELVQSEHEGIIYYDANLARLRWLRQAEDSRDRVYNGVEYSSKPGIFTQWRRPELWRILSDRKTK